MSELTPTQRVSNAMAYDGAAQRLNALQTVAHQLATELERVKEEIDALRVARTKAEFGQAKAELEHEQLRAQNAELVKDKERLDWLQKGHCVLALCVFSKDSEDRIGTLFEIDGHQGCATNESLRQAIDEARK